LAMSASIKGGGIRAGCALHAQRPLAPDGAR
jgi:hypothetical protein